MYVIAHRVYVHATPCIQAMVLNAHAYMVCSAAIGIAVNLLSYNYTRTSTATTIRSITAARCWSVCVTSAHQSTPIVVLVGAERE
jgi:nucleoside recognition membrane protein YjiH